MPKHEHVIAEVILAQVQGDPMIITFKQQGIEIARVYHYPDELRIDLEGVMHSSKSEGIIPVRDLMLKFYEEVGWNNPQMER